MKNVSAVIFDLDDTLVSTSSVEGFRRSRDKDGLLENLHLTSIYAPVPWLMHEIKNLGIPIGIVTNSPKWYAQAVMAFHGIVVDVLICYDDVSSSGVKPSPIGIHKALKELNVTPDNRVLYVGDAETDFIAAYSAKVVPIAPSWAKRAPVSQIPAAIVNSKTLVDSLKQTEDFGLIADITAEKRNFNFPKKQLNFLPLNDDAELIPLKRSEVRLIALGRYFSKNSELTALLHEDHSLSKDMFAKEKSSSYVIPSYYVDLMGRVIKNLPKYVFDDEYGFDIVTVIPAKPGKNNRLENFLGRLRASSEEGNSQFISDIFKFLPQSKSLKTLGSKRNRSDELNKSLYIKSKYKPSLEGKTILIIDDIITTGATFNRAFELLYGAGAKLVFGVCIAKTVSVKEELKNCPICQRVMQIRTNKKSGEHFFGCSGFYETPQCKYTMSIGGRV